jgi:non-ribosomal peptide synthetase component F
MVNHRSVVRLVKNTNFVQFNQATRILQTGAPVFDATTFEIWGSLLNGGELVVINKEIILNAYRLANALKDYHINTLWLSSPLFNRLMQENSDLFILQIFVGRGRLIPQPD